MTHDDKSVETELQFSNDLNTLAETEPRLSQTKPNKGGRPRKSPDVIPWTIRGVDTETRTAIEKAATRSGKTIGQFMNEDLRHYAQEQLKKGNQPPVKQEDIRSELDSIKGILAELSQRIPVVEKRSILKRIFG